MPSGAAEPDAAAGLALERVVLLMRHGIRPPTRATVTPPGIAAAPWPKWDAPYGHLTAHGAEAIRLLGRFDRESLVARGLLPSEGCSKTGVGFELLADRAGARYVRVFYRSQSLQQMRELTPLDAARPAFRQDRGRLVNRSWAPRRSRRDWRRPSS